MSAAQACNDAVSAAKIAVDYDMRKDYAKAGEAYILAIEACLHVSVHPGVDEAKQAAFRAKSEEYLARAEMLRRLQALKAPTVAAPAPGVSGGAPVPPPRDPSLVAAGIGAATAVGAATARVASDLDARYAIRDKTAAALSATAVKARELDEEYKIRERTASAARTGAAKAVEINREYKITERTAAAAKAGVAKAREINHEYKVVDRTVAATKSAVAKAKEIDERHQVHQKVGTVAKATYVGAKDFNEKHQITNRAGAALLSGLNYVSGAAERALASREEGAASGSGAGTGTTATASATAPPRG